MKKFIIFYRNKMKKLIKNANILNENNELINVNILINENIIEKIYENNEKLKIYLIFQSSMHKTI